MRLFHRGRECRVRCGLLVMAAGGAASGRRHGTARVPVAILKGKLGATAAVVKGRDPRPRVSLRHRPGRRRRSSTHRSLASSG